MREHDDRRFLELQLACSKHAAVACDQNTILANENRVTKPISAIEPAIWATWASEWVLAFRAWGISRSSGHCSIWAEKSDCMGCSAFEGESPVWFKLGEEVTG